MQLMIAHPNRAYASALASALAKADPHNMIYLADSGSALAIEQETFRLSPDLLVVAHGPENLGCEVLRRVLLTRPDAQVAVIDVPEDEQRILQVIELGAAGFETRGAPLSRLTANLAAIERGETLCTPRVTRLLFERLAVARRCQRSATSDPVHLTRREMEIVRLIEQGCANKEIARMLNIQLQTVKNHVHNILQKLNVPGRREAVRLLKNRGLLAERPTPVAFEREVVSS